MLDKLMYKVENPAPPPTIQPSQSDTVFLQTYEESEQHSYSNDDQSCSDTASQSAVTATTKASKGKANSKASASASIIAQTTTDPAVIALLTAQLELTREMAALAERKKPLEELERLKGQVSKGPLDADVLESLTVNSPRPEEREWTLNGLRYGFKLGFTGPKTGIHRYSP